MKKLVHPNIVQLVEVIDAPMDSSLYLVMEYVERGAVMRCVESDRGRYASPATGKYLRQRGERVARSMGCLPGLFRIILP